MFTFHFEINECMYRKMLLLIQAHNIRQVNDDHTIMIDLFLLSSFLLHILKFNSTIYIKKRNQSQGYLL